MVVSRNQFFVWLFCIFIQRNIQSCSANNNNNNNDNCLNLKLKSSDKLNIQLYFQSEHANNLDAIACPVLHKYSDNLTFEFKMGPLAKGKKGDLTCPNDNGCASNRYLACVHKAANGQLNKCIDIKTITFDDIKLADCTCNHETDDVLLQNAQDWAKLNLSDDKLPTLILNGKWDPCLAVSSSDAFDKYVYKIFH